MPDVEWHRRYRLSGARRHSLSNCSAHTRRASSLHVRRSRARAIPNQRAVEQHLRPRPVGTGGMSGSVTVTIPTLLRSVSSGTGLTIRSLKVVEAKNSYVKLPEAHLRGEGASKSAQPPRSQHRPSRAAVEDCPRRLSGFPGVLDRLQRSERRHPSRSST